MPNIAPITESPRTKDEDVQRQFEGTPTFEVRVLVSWVAAYPVSVELDSPVPMMVVANARESRDSEATVDASIPSYFISEGGITISNIAGVTAGTEYDVTLFVVGARA